MNDTFTDLHRNMREVTGNRYVSLQYESTWYSCEDAADPGNYRAWIVPGIYQDCTILAGASPEELLAKTKELFSQPHDRHPTDNPL